jgi:hypothetical protein
MLAQGMMMSIVETKKCRETLSDLILELVLLYHCPCSTHRMMLFTREMTSAMLVGP